MGRSSSLPVAVLGLLGALVALPSRAAGAQVPSAGVDVPLERLPGVPTFVSAGGSFLDFDGDGWVDYFAYREGELWHNRDGLWFEPLDLDAFLPPRAGGRYGSSAGDYDGDGRPDLACAPRDDCFYLLHNEGAGAFREVASDPGVLATRLSCRMYGESFAWCDVDEDGDLDLWLTAYPNEVQPGSGGNRFLENLGPGPSGAYRFEDHTETSGLAIPRRLNRPEGAQFVDVDRDGDPDAYANGTLYQNVSAGDGVRFVPLVRAPTGIELASELDEGAVFLDYDLDGDPDLVLVLGGRNVLYENEGDGTFVDASERLEAPALGAFLGCSAEDWDLDGDLDLTTSSTFRRNLLVETGEARLVLASTSIPSNLLRLSQPSWADWDLDGDLDCALANYALRGAFLRNTLFDVATPALARNSVRVVPLADSPTVARGVESEYGATVELRAKGDARVRRRFVASSHGYLQQSEYALTMAVPAGADAERPALGVEFELLVDFPSSPRNGILRVDRHVNPFLAALSLERLPSREVRVFESGKVRAGEQDHLPDGRFAPRLWSSGALLLPRPDLPTPEPVAAPLPEWLVGLEFETRVGAGPVQACELVVDGELAPGGTTRCSANLFLWDVTPGAAATLVRQETRASSPRNDRAFLALDWSLKPGRVYRLLARVRSLRASPRAPVSPARALQVHGGFAGPHRNPCATPFTPLAELEPQSSYLELRYHERPAAVRTPR